MKKVITLSIVIFILISVAAVPTFMCYPMQTASAATQSYTMVAKDNITYLGQVAACGKDNGYQVGVGNSTNWLNAVVKWTTPIGIATNALIGKDNPLYGIDFGSFAVRGYSARQASDDGTVFLKNVGDQVEVGFDLRVDIDDVCGLGPNQVVVCNDVDTSFSNCYIQEPYYDGENFGRGALFVQKTDHTGKTTTVKYFDYLNGMKKGACTKIDLLEEGTYRLILVFECYKHIYDMFGVRCNWRIDPLTPEAVWYDYRCETKFTIVNGNAMVFPIDLGTKSELLNGDHSDTGFKIDIAGSKYLEVSVKKEVISNDGKSLDTRFNRQVADGTEFKDEGIYTITCYNQYTDEETEKVIYVGQDPRVKWLSQNDMTLSWLNSYLDRGYTLSSNGTLTKADTDEAIPATKTNKATASVANATGLTSGQKVGVSFAVIGMVVVIVIMGIIIVKRHRYC